MKTTTTREEILEIDFYDLCGVWAIWMSDDDKVKYWLELTGYELTPQPPKHQE